MKILVATQKPFAKAAVDGIRKIAEENGHTLALLEKYPGEAELIASWLKAYTGKRENRANHKSIQWIEGSRAHQVSCFLA